MLRLTARILSVLLFSISAQTASAARPISEYYAILGLTDRATPVEVDREFVNRIGQIMSAAALQPADWLGRNYWPDQPPAALQAMASVLETHLIRGHIDFDEFQRQMADAGDGLEDLIFRDPVHRLQYLNAIEAFVMIRAQNLAQSELPGVGIDQVERAFDDWKAQGTRVARQVEVQSAKRSKGARTLALLLAFGSSKLLLENVFGLANASGSRTWIVTVAVTSALYVLLPKLYASQAGVDFGRFSSWMVGTYRRAVVSSVSASIVIGSCVKLVQKVW